MKSTTLTTLLTFLAAVSAHPGEDHTHEAAERAAALNLMGKRSLSHCADKLAARGVHAQNQIRRRAFLDSVQAMRKRDITSVLATDHKSNLTGITAATSPDTVFSGQNQCILAPEVTQGPYYVTGEYFRQNITEGQAGVPLYLDIQVIDTNTCEPISNAALDLWHCNATGVYSGVVASGNGDSSDASNLNATFLRGIQSTDSDGVVQFRTIVPGHYSGRTNHIHVLAHTNWTLLANNTISGGEQGAHVGQIFVDQDLLTEVEATEPYASNTQAHTLNSEDNIMSQEAADFDPVFEYVLLGDSVDAGIFGWISIGVNASASYDVSPAVRYGADGGVVNENASLGGGPGGGPGGPGGNGTMPGGMGNGTMPGGMGNGTMPSGMPGGAAPSGTMMPGGASGTAAIPQDSAAPTDVAPTESASDAVTATASSPDSKHSHAQQSHNNESHTNQSPAEQSHGKGSHTKASHTKQFGAKPTGAKQNGTMESDHQQSDDQELEDSQCNNTRQRRRR